MPGTALTLSAPWDASWSRSHSCLKDRADVSPCTCHSVQAGGQFCPPKWPQEAARSAQDRWLVWGRRQERNERSLTRGLTGDGALMGPPTHPHPVWLSTTGREPDAEDAGDVSHATWWMDADAKTGGATVASFWLRVEEKQSVWEKDLKAQRVRSTSGWSLRM